MLKRLMIALAGYAVYRWWNGRDEPEERDRPAPAGRSRMTPPD